MLLYIRSKTVTPVFVLNLSCTLQVQKKHDCVVGKCLFKFISIWLTSYVDL